MPSPFSSAGRADIRDYIQQNWGWVGLRTPTGDVITRIDVNGDNRASWSHDSETDEYIEATIEIARSDSDIDGYNPDGPVDIGDTVSFTSGTDSSYKSVDSADDVTLEAEDDSAVVTHRIYF